MKLYRIPRMRIAINLDAIRSIDTIDNPQGENLPEDMKGMPMVSIHLADVTQNIAFRKVEARNKYFNKLIKEINNYENKDAKTKSQRLCHQSK